MSPQQQLEAAREIQQRILRGDLMIGIMDLSEADRMTDLFRQASDAGLAEASFELAGELLDADPAAAVQLFGRAADQGYGRDARLQQLRTACYRAPDAMTAEAVQAAMAGLLNDDPTGQGALLRGYFHTHGFGYDADPRQAFEWHSRAAEKGNEDAMFELSVLCAKGQGTDADPVAAMDWTRRAADAGSVRAMYNLGSFHATGNMVERDPAASVRWYTAAAEAGHGRAAATLAVMYATGNGVTADSTAAARFFALADQNDFDVQGFFARLGIPPPA